MVWYCQLRKIKKIVGISNNKRLVIVDGSSLFFRAYYAVPQMLSQDNYPVGALYGFIQSLKFVLRRVLSKKHESFLAVALDVGGGSNFRYEIYDSYKNNRKAAPPDLIYQLQLSQPMLDAFGIKYLYDKNCEADDVIAAYAKHAAEQNYEVVIVSGDKDLMQLISDRILFFDITKKKFCNFTDVYDKFGVRPDQICDYLSIVGDRADNIPGIRGIGKKIAAELLKNFENLEYIYENIHNIEQPRVRKLLENGYESAILSRKLVMLKDNLMLQHTIDDMKWFGFKQNTEQISSFLTRYSLESLINI